MDIKILYNYFLNDNGTFNKKEALKAAGKMAGICYSPEGIDSLLVEAESKTNKRIENTLNNGHHSVYDHITINFYIDNIPKILAMVLNNEHQYTTSERSGRYVEITQNEDFITDIEIELYRKWFKIFETKIKKEYGNIYNDFKIRNLAKENARNFVTVFLPTKMFYTTSLRQINYIASWMNDYIKNANNEFEKKLSFYMKEFINKLSDLNVLEDALMKNEKQRKISLFNEEIENICEYFSDGYSTNYKVSLSCLAQEQRNRTLYYQMKFLNDYNYFIPPIIEDDKYLVDEYINDMERVKEFIPNGELVLVNESGNFDKFIEKCKERLCSEAQLEIMLQTKKTLEQYKKVLEEKNHPLASKIKLYSRGARCTFKDYTCSKDCKFAEGKTLERRI